MWRRSVLFVAFLCSGFLACSDGNKPAAGQAPAPAPDAAPPAIKVDTDTGPVEVDGHLYVFGFFSTRDSDECNPYGGLMITQEDGNKTRFFDTSQAFKGDYSLIKANGANLDKPGRLFFTVLSSGCGSGYTCDLYTVSRAGDSIALSRVMQYGELSLIKFSADGNRILQLHGKWGDSEGHFDNHIFEIAVYMPDGNGWKRTLLGNTTNKYNGVDCDGCNADSILSQINENEPQLFASISDSGVLKLLDKAQ